MTRYTILSYAPRSGSTKLANELSRFENGPAVMPEFRSLLWLCERVEPGHPIPIDQLVALLRSDRQLRDLGICIDDVVNGLGTKPTVLDVTNEIVRQHLGPQPAVLLKHGRAIEAADRVRAHMPETRFLYIVRDPRAVANSMHRSVIPRDPLGATFSYGNERSAIRLWSRRFSAFERLRRSNPGSTYLVRFEDLASPAGLSAIVEWLDPPSAPPVSSTDARCLSGTSLAQSIPTAERAIHRLVEQPFGVDRIDAWHEELEKKAARDVQVLLWKELVELDYCQGAAPSVFDRVAARARGALAMGPETIRRLRSKVAVSRVERQEHT